MYIFLQKGTGGGLSYIFNRYSKPNNKYLKSYDSNQNSKHILYLDANNSYAYTMSTFVPTSEFKWISHEDVSAR